MTRSVVRTQIAMGRVALGDLRGGAMERGGKRDLWWNEGVADPPDGAKRSGGLESTARLADVAHGDDGEVECGPSRRKDFEVAASDRPDLAPKGTAPGRGADSRGRVSEEWRPVA
jgi:hypothetical protein